MFNVLLDPMPEEWGGYKINTSYRVGIMLELIQHDPTLNKYERMDAMVNVLFANEDGSLRSHPVGEELAECIYTYLNGWNHDKHDADGNETRRRVMDYNVDQWRIYADFLQIYGINLATTDMHFWKFEGLLWNMPPEQSSFLQVVGIRQRRVEDGMNAKTVKLIQQQQAVYGLDEDKPEYTDEQKAQIDAFDEMMAKLGGE